ncbi:Putative LOC100908673 [Caligus rogercresseyi]|uniref:LOC100908673 n=1 Tax=Caligus rogercresseyi TaxID=217165 RepID=A0A7T8K739_CALRO|nr:Putative LOC100908673 [Caligus rogercresseyi]
MPFLSELLGISCQLRDGRFLLSTTLERINYFEKTCLQGPGCEKAWLFERVPGYELVGFDDVVLKDIPSRVDCQDSCLNQVELPCRSAIYDYSLQICRLSKNTRRTQPTAYR